MSWTTLPNGAVAAGGLPSGETVTALRDNPVSIAAGDAGAPVVATGWHPYNMAAVGDASDGKIWDFAVDGAVTTIITPDFEDGYEYGLIFDRISTSAATPDMRADPYLQTIATYAINTLFTGVTAASTYSGTMHVILPRVQSMIHAIGWITPMVDNVGTQVAAATNRIFHSTVQPVLRVRLLLTSGTFDAGKIYMLRRREYVTG